MSAKLFVSYIVELQSKNVWNDNLKVKVGANSQENAIKAAIRKYPEYSSEDVVRTVMPKAAIKSGEVLSKFQGHNQFRKSR